MISPLAKTVERARRRVARQLQRASVRRIVAPLPHSLARSSSFSRRCAARVLPLLGSACAVVGVILTAGLSMFPFMMPSSTNPGSSLTAWDAVSSKLTLQIMFWVVVVFLPIVTLYTAWVYREAPRHDHASKRSATRY